VRFEKTTYAGLPTKFEAGTPDIAGVVGLGAAVDYLAGLDLRVTAVYEAELLAYATARLMEVPGLRIIGTAKKKAGVISFVMDQPPLKDAVSALDIGVKLDREGICVRTGHHCCMPVMERFGIPATTRASFSFYNTKGEVDRLVDALCRIAAEQQDAVGPRQEKGTVVYPGPTANSVAAAAAALADDFALMEENGGREAKSEYLMDLAKRLPATFEDLKLVTERVPGCMAQVYLVGREKPGQRGVMEFVADADAEVVRGLIVMLQKLYSGQKASEVAGFDVEKFFGRIGLEQFITSQRRNGLAGMVARIQGIANEIAGK
jgi:cysteine desulfurase/selenocysteine lyase